jgi:hypothetical protein
MFWILALQRLLLFICRLLTKPASDIGRLRGKKTPRHDWSLLNLSLNLNLWSDRALRERRRSSGSSPPLLAPAGKSILLLEPDGYLVRVGTGV